MTKQNVTNSGDLTFIKYALVVALILLAFLMSYQFARGGAAAEASLTEQSAAAGGCGSGGSGGCGSGSGAVVEGSTVVEADGVQRIAVDTSAGTFTPNVVRATAGVPIEIQFSQAPGGCMAGVWFPQFDVMEDLVGGPKTVSLPALEPGQYPFYCQMQMISAMLVVE